MRDAVLDRLVQPAVERWALPAERLSRELAVGYGALMLASAAGRFDPLQSSWFGAFLQILIAIALSGALARMAAAGPSVLSSPFATVHMLSRTLLLGLAACGILQDVLAAACGLIGPDDRPLAVVASDLAQLCAAASMYLGVCDRPPPRRRLPQGARA